MHVNRRRGEISARLDGTDYRLCLTLGALAELEDAFAADDLNQLVQRFSTGRLSARDMVRVIAAGLRGAGHSLSDREVEAMHCDDGVAGFARIVGALLVATFGSSEDAATPQNP
ncbi:gene transfer agent family protein [Nitratireductor soli]|uniref:gene transfer agent family protein n=1 Tax=Nitratireductor soli TaxID=1670619 RepID=UPI00065E17E8|nr:gene transfer agent family protein [Nitratireductor soli]